MFSLTPTLGSQILIYDNRASKMNLFGVQKFFFMNFYFNNWCKNELKDNNEKS